MAFQPGFYAFPGGKLDPDEDDRVCAARELFEETGARVDPATLVDVGRWVTPAFAPRRFDTCFFLARCPEGEDPHVASDEHDVGEWIEPGVALERWMNGEILAANPVMHAVRCLAEGLTDIEMRLKASPWANGEPSTEIEMRPGIVLVPLRTPTLPPATHTNVYVLGNSDLVVVDPGSPDDAETDKLKAFLDGLRADGFKPRATILTHHHGDHVGGVKRLGLPVWCHPVTAQKLGITADRELKDGEVLEIGGMRWKVLHTPGHAQGHVCLFDAYASKALIAGDMVAGVGTIVIDPPEGDMAEYLRQLQRLKDLEVRTIYPAHGPPLPDGPAKLDEYLKHRAWREEKVLAALSAELQTLEALVPKAYDDVASFVLPIAERSTLAILEKLRSEGRASAEGERWRRN